jgi:hypothetical protein
METSSSPSTPPPLPRKEGMGCFAKGCLTLIIALFILGGVVIGGVWYLYGRAINVFTSSQPAAIQIERPSDAQFQAAKGKLEQLRAAISRNEETTVEFSAADVNTLIACDPAFAGARDKARVNMAESIVTVELSAPLDAVPLPKLKHRWFNGTASFQFTYDLGQFIVSAKSAEANGKAVPEAFFASFSSSFNRSFNQRFQEELQKNNEKATFWKRIKTIGVEGGNLIVKTQRRDI